MASMSRTTSTGSIQGFSVYQPTLGAPLQFLPAVGTKELEKLIDAYLPGPAPASEKRASISMDFFDHSNQTGENFKYYAVYTPVATPESSYAASFDASPVMSDLSFYSSPSQTPTPAAAPAAKKARVASRKPATKQERNDFASLPGMKILTKDGQDVTNSVSRGCKSKEQRDHAHLMRILKACDACKKKKIRCDPSHKKRSASQLEPEPKAEAAKPVKKTKKTTSKSMAESTASQPSSAGYSFQMDDVGLNPDLSAPLDESWEQYLTFNDESATASIPQDFYGAIPTDFDFFFGVENNFSPSASGSSGSSGSPMQPMTPSNSGIAPSIDDFAMGNDGTLAFLQSEDSSQELALPYLNPSGQHGSNYVDFNLFSPASSFVDEEPQLLKSGGKRSMPASQTQPESANAPAPAPGTGLFGDTDWHFDHAQFTVNPGEPERQVPRGRVSPVLQLVSDNGEQGLHGSSLPYHANDAGHNTNQSVNAVTRLQGLQSVGTNSPVATTGSRGESLLRGTSLNSFSAATSPASLLSRSASPLAVHHATGMLEGTGNAHVASQTVSPAELQVLDLGRRRPAHSTTNTGLPLATTPTAVVSSSNSGNPSLQGLPAAGLQDVNIPVAAVAANGNTPVATVAANGVGRSAVVVSSSSGSLLVGQHRSPGAGNANAALPVHGLSLSQTPSLSQGLLSPAAHLPMRILEMILAGGALLHTLPVRQLLRNPTVLSWLVAFGLVSMLMVVALSILPTQTQTSILSNLPSTSMILLSLLSAASAHQRPRANLFGGALDSLRSKSSGRTASTYRRSLPSWAALVARATLVSCI